MARGGKKPKKRRIVGGVDTHADAHHAAVELMNGGRIADAQFPATADGYAQLLVWMRSFGRLHAVGVEGTGSYGAGLARYLRGQGVHVVEVNRPDRRQRRNLGKSDPLDAYAAADAVLAGRARALPKGGDGIAESIRTVHLARSGAIKARTACINELRSLLVTAPAELRERMAGTSAPALAAACARLRPAADLADPIQGTKLALRSLAHRYQALTAEIEDLDAHLAALVAQARPKLLAVHGVGPETAAQLLVTYGDNPDRLTSSAAFAALCGVAPIPASSGKPPGTGSRAEETARPTVPSTSSCSPAWPGAPARAPTSPAAPPRASPRKRSPLPQTLRRSRALQSPHQPKRRQQRGSRCCLTNIGASERFTNPSGYAPAALPRERAEAALSYTDRSSRDSTARNRSSDSFGHTSFHRRRSVR
jgi:transposase